MSRSVCPLCGSSNVRERRYGYPGPEMWAEAELGDITLGGCVVTGDDPPLGCLGCGAGFWPDGRFQPAGAPHGTQHIHLGDDLVASFGFADGLHLTVTERGPLVASVHGTDEHRTRLDVDAGDADDVVVIALDVLFDDPEDLRRWAADHDIPCQVRPGKELQVPTTFHTRFAVLLLQELFAAGVDWHTFASTLTSRGIPFDLVDVEAEKAEFEAYAQRWLGGRGEVDGHNGGQGG